MSVVASFGELVQPLAGVMTAPTFVSFVTLLGGWLFAPCRTVTAAIVAAGRHARKHHSAYHRLLASARWSLDELGLALAALILALVEGPVFLAVDDTLARKRGRKTFGVGMHLDPLLSSRRTHGMNWGHSWVVIGIVVSFPFHPHRYFCLPILWRLYRNQPTVAREGGRYHTRPELAVELLQRLGAQFPHRRFHALGDSAYGGQSVLKQLPANCDLTSRLLLDARLYDAAPPRHPGRNGRPRKRVKRLPTPRALLAQRCRQMTLELYGRHDRVRWAEIVGYLHALPERAVRMVAVDPLRGGRQRQAFYSTCVSATAVEILTWYAHRWAIEQTFQESKQHLGFEEPPGWTRRAVERTAPLAMLLYSLVVLWFARAGHRQWCPVERAWYRRKCWPAFADMLVTIRQQSLRQEVFQRAGSNQSLQKTMLNVLNSLKFAA